MAAKQRADRRRTQDDTIRRLLVADALTSWVIPAAHFVMLALAVILNALGILADATSAAVALVALLILWAFTVLSPALTARREVSWTILLALAVVWVGLVYVPFHLRLFPGPTIAHFPVLDSTMLPVRGHGARFDLLVEGHFTPASDQHDRFVHYAFDLVDAQGASQAVEGELSDRWRTRRLGRRGTAPSHLEHLSAIHVVDDPPRGDLRVRHLALSGDKAGGLVASVYAHRGVPIAGLTAAALLLVLGALAYDRWLDPDATPSASLLTAVAGATAIVFTASGAGHPGFRDLIGAALVGAVIGVPLAFLLARLVRTAMRVSSRRVRPTA